jgi:hypothetical protein
VTLASPREPTAGIVWLASFPKSGNTWVRLFLAALRRGAEVDLASMEGTFLMASGRFMIERHLDIGLADLSWQEAAELRPLAYRAMARAAAGPLIMKTHDLRGATPSGAALFPPDATWGCVHLVRDPRDVCLSLAAHMDATVDAAIAEMGDARSASGPASKAQVREFRGSWTTHGESWLTAPFRRLTLRYEDMVADPLANLAAIARFCCFETAPEAVAAAAAATEFSRLAAREGESGFGERLSETSRFFRSGTAGQWRDALSPAQIARIEQDHCGLMRRFGYALATEPDLNRSSPDASAGSG